MDTCSPFPLAGYECNFAESVPESLSCPVCLLPFRDPHIVSCCGNKFCEACIGRVKAVSNQCPLCKQEFTSLIDKQDQRKVLSLKVFCSKHEDGCGWIGELRHLDHHEREACECTVVECRYQCGTHLPRRLMDEHELHECQQRPIDVKIKSVMKSMETKLAMEREEHKGEMAAIREAHKKEMEEMKQMLADQKRETEKKMAEQKVSKLLTIAS